MQRSALSAGVAMTVLAALGCAPPEPDESIGKEELAVTVCSDGPTTLGIDVSRYQGAIDWTKIAGAGVEFAYIQISRNIDDIDPKFEFNWKQAKAVGILRGAYQRFHPGQDVAKQAKIFLDKLGPFQPGDLPPMLDVEDDDGLSAAVITDRVRQWLQIVEDATGVRPFVYTYPSFWDNQMKNADLTEYPLWIAHYTDGCPLTPAPWKNWVIHQYSSKAVLPGITENTVDVNRFNGTLDELAAMAAPPECGDGVCSGGETANSCETDCPPCQLIGSQGGFLEEDGPCFYPGGNTDYMRSESEGHGGALMWTHTTDSDQVANYGQWNLHFGEGGRYLVEVYTPAPWSMSKRAVYHIHHDGGDSSIELDQSAIDGWSALGELEFAQGGEQWIRTNDNTGEPNDSNTKLVFDAVRVTRLDPPEVGDDDDSPPSGGCNVGDQPSPFPLLLVALGLALARRRNGPEPEARPVRSSDEL